MKDAPRERPVRRGETPADFAPLIAGRRWSRDLVGEAGCAVHRLHAAGLPDLFLKQGRGDAAADLADEYARLRWLAGRLPTPAVMAFSASGEEAHLLTTAIPGRTAWQMLTEDPAGREAVVDALANFLLRLHALPVDVCPFDSGSPRLALARGRMEARLVDGDDFGDAHKGWTAEQVWVELEHLGGFEVHPVVPHGDFSLDNILVADGEVTGCIDVGRLGVADRWQDLAIMWDCLDEFDAALQARLLESYGVALDERRLRFHLALDEFF